MMNENFKSLKDRMNIAARKTWYEIGPDIEATKSFRRLRGTDVLNAAADAVLDADYLLMFGGDPELANLVYEECKSVQRLLYWHGIIVRSLMGVAT